MMHWGLYCELGMVASWALSDKDAEWSRHQVNWTEDKETFKKQYFGLNKSFNPYGSSRKSGPRWQRTAVPLSSADYQAPRRLLSVGYRLHRLQGYRRGLPFHENEHADIVKSMFDAFREKGIGIGAYFSKQTGTVGLLESELRKDGLTSRGPSYDPKEYPEIWSRFQEFTKTRFWSSVGIRKTGYSLV